MRSVYIILSPARTICYLTYQTLFVLWSFVTVNWDPPHTPHRPITAPKWPTLQRVWGHTVAILRNYMGTLTTLTYWARYTLHALLRSSRMELRKDVILHEDVLSYKGKCILCKYLRLLVIELFTYDPCRDRHYDYYLKQKGIPLPDIPPKHRIKAIVSRALENRLRLEKKKTYWHKTRGGRGPHVYREGPYRQWEGYSIPREQDLEGIRQESKQGVTGGQEHAQGSRQESRQDQSLEVRVCFFYNQKKLLREFGCFWTCNKCRVRNKKASTTRNRRISALINKQRENKDTS
jgi:hypothetical protein